MKLGDADRSFLRYRKGGGTCYFTGSLSSTGLSTLVNTTSGRLFALPFFIAKNLVVDRIAFNVTTLIAAKLANAGVYEDTRWVYPGVKIIQGGEFSTGTTGVKETTLSPTVTLFGGKLYWLAFWTNSTATGAFRALAVGSLSCTFFGLDSTLGTAWGTAWYKDETYSATMPNPFNAGATIFTSAVHTTIPAVFLRAG